MNTHHYPPAPANVAPEMTAPSAAFRKQVIQTMMSLVFFIVVYCVMLALGVGLVWLCFKIGMVFFQLEVRSIWVFILGGAIMLMGILVFFFLIKFVFPGDSEAPPEQFEITPEDDPGLFQFVGQVAKEVGTPTPKRIFLTHEVNASVTYASAFQSLFFPTRKNLTIGLGLVNSLNISEFKSVLAHEFGHFSQRSMRLGTYVYYLNKMIFNLLFKNEGWSNAMNALASIHGVVYLFVVGAAKIMEGIQWVLQQLYKVINLEYKRLSREMEFHADAIAASVSGSNIGISALCRIHHADSMFQTTVKHVNQKIELQQQPANFFAAHRAAQQQFAASHALALESDLPVIDVQLIQKQHFSQIEIDNPWESHPSLQDRVQAIDRMGLNAAPIHQSAWVAFSHPDQWQKAITDQLLGHLEKERMTIVDDQEYVAAFRNEMEQEMQPVFYRGYFDEYAFADDHLDTYAPKDTDRVLSKKELQALFEVNVYQKLLHIDSDIEMLNQARSQTEIKSFSFKSSWYAIDDAYTVIQQLEAEKNTLKKLHLEQERAIYATFYQLAKQKSATSEFSGKYAEALQLQRWMTSVSEPFQDAVKVILTLNANHFNCPNELTTDFKDLVTKHFVKLRAEIQVLNQQYPFDAELQKKTDLFLDEAATDFGLSTWQPRAEELVGAFHYLIEVNNWAKKRFFAALKEVLVFQEKLL